MKEDGGFDEDDDLTELTVASVAEAMEVTPPVTEILTGDEEIFELVADENSSLEDETIET